MRWGGDEWRLPTLLHWADALEQGSEVGGGLVRAERGWPRRVFSTHYSCSCGYGSIVADGKQIAKFDTLRHFREVEWVPDEDNSGWARKVVAPIRPAERCEHPISVPREFERGDLHEACWRLLHTNAHVALADAGPLLVTLAVLNAKVGIGRLRSLRAQEIHPLVRWAVEFRLEAEAARKLGIAG